MPNSLRQSPATARRVSFGVVVATLFVTACGGTPVTTTASPATLISFTTAVTPAVAELTTATSASTAVTPTTTDVPATATVVPATATALQPTAAPTATVPPPTVTVVPPTSTALPPTRLPTLVPRIVATVPVALPNTPAATKGPAIDAAAVARGKAIFLSTVGCALCHTINGLSSGDQGPNLTHIAGQPYDSLPNDPAFLRRWIANPQAIKPGTIMPDLGLSAAQVNDLVAFLETMK